MKNIAVQFHQHLPFFRKHKVQAGTLRKTLLHVCTDFQRELAQLDIIFVDDEELLLMNRDFLQHDYYTDIITFDLSEDLRSIQGELYVSRDRVLENALSLGSSSMDEILRVCIHGLLHLCGMNDSSEAEKLAMRDAENTYIQFYKNLD
ncbi:MAG: rRNA maturation RNase YbeY [Bacteroidia bacterium]